MDLESQMRHNFENLESVVVVPELFQWICNDEIESKSVQRKVDQENKIFG